MGFEPGAGPTPRPEEYPTLQAVVKTQAVTAKLAEKHKGVVRDFYYPRRVHIPLRLWQALIGMASHAAWKQLLAEGVERVRGRFPFDTIRARRSEILKKMADELLRALAETGKLPPIPVIRPVPKLVTIEVPATPTTRGR